MKIKVSMERKITSAIISILSCILLFLCGPLLYNIRKRSIVGTLAGYKKI